MTAPFSVPSYLIKPTQSEPSRDSYKLQHSASYPDFSYELVSIPSRDSYKLQLPQ
jgi:hypothetical protein